MALKNQTMLYLLWVNVVQVQGLEHNEKVCHSCSSINFRIIKIIILLNNTRTHVSVFLTGTVFSWQLRTTELNFNRCHLMLINSCAQCNLTQLHLQQYFKSHWCLNFLLLLSRVSRNLGFTNTNPKVVEPSKKHFKPTFWWIFLFYLRFLPDNILRWN